MACRLQLTVQRTQQQGQQRAGPERTPRWKWFVITLGLPELVYTLQSRLLLLSSFPRTLHASVTSKNNLHCDSWSQGRGV